MTQIFDRVVDPDDNRDSNGNPTDRVVGSQYSDEDMLTAEAYMNADELSQGLYEDANGVWLRDGHTFVLTDHPITDDQQARIAVFLAVDAKARRDEARAREYRREQMLSAHDSWRRRVSFITESLKRDVADALLAALRMEVAPFTGDDHPRVRLTIPPNGIASGPVRPDLLLSMRYTQREEKLYIDHIEAPYALTESELEDDHYDWPSIHLTTGTGIPDDLAALIVWAQARINRAVWR